jgi:hypothetical protein
VKIRVITANLPVHDDKNYQWDGRCPRPGKSLGLRGRWLVDLEAYEKAFLFASDDSDDLQKRIPDCRYLM